MNKAQKILEAISIEVPLEEGSVKYKAAEQKNNVEEIWKKWVSMHSTPANKASNKSIFNHWKNSAIELII